MERVAATPAYWSSDQAQSVLEWIREGRADRRFRPTVVVVLLDHDDRFLIVRHNTRERNWGLIQGGIKETDTDPIAAGMREAWEESCLTADQVEHSYPYFGHMEFGRRKNVNRGYRLGSRYIFIGLKLKKGEDISCEPAPGHPVALLERRWCDTVEEAMHVLRDQPAADPETLLRVENGLIPTLKLVREAKMNGLLELLPVLSPIM